MNKPADMKPLNGIHSSISQDTKTNFKEMLVATPNKPLRDNAKYPFILQKVNV